MLRQEWLPACTLAGTVANVKQISHTNTFLVMFHRMVLFLGAVQIKDQNRNFEASLNFGLGTLTGILFSLLSILTWSFVFPLSGQAS